MDRRPLFFEKMHLLNSATKLLLRKTRVQLVLVGWLLPGLAARSAARFRSGLPVAKVIATLALTGAIIIPSALYLKERGERIELSRAYRYLRASSSSEIGTLEYTIGALMNEQAELRSLLLDKGRPVISDGELAIQMIATGYSSCVFETDDTPFITASNTRTRTGIIALSRDLLKRYNPNAPFSFGDTVHLTGFGDFIVEDSMHWRWRRRVDIWFPDRSLARQFGVRKIVVTKPISDDSGSDETASVQGTGAGFVANTALAP